MDYYAILGVSSQADRAAIRRAFRKLARRYHPDAGEGSSPERFRELVEAYETLMSPERRRAYDRSLRPRLRVPVEPMTARPYASDYDARRELLREFAEIEREFDALFRRRW
jgi:curved DNA-binding protein CbpA